MRLFIFHDFSSTKSEHNGKVNNWNPIDYNFLPVKMDTVEIFTSGIESENKLLIQTGIQQKACAIHVPFSFVKIYFFCNELCENWCIYSFFSVQIHLKVQIHLSKYNGPSFEKERQVLNYELWEVHMRFVYLFAQHRNTVQLNVISIEKHQNEIGISLDYWFRI